MEDEAAGSIKQWGQRGLNFASSFLFVTCSFLVYRFSPHVSASRQFIDDRTGLSGTEVLTGAYLMYSLLLLFFYFGEKTTRLSKSIAALRAIRAMFASSRRATFSDLPREERVGLLTILLKGFFAPIMLLSMFKFTSGMVECGFRLMEQLPVRDGNMMGLYNSHGYWLLFQLILFLDVFFYTVGYLVEHPALKNEIRSVDPTWSGWLVALACYPPFNWVTARFMGGNVSDFPQFETPAIHLAVSLLMLLLMAIYTWASISLNLKASNLTHRGIIGHGPYRFVRHPAYAAKNMAWWLGSIPAFLAAWEWSRWDAMVVLAGAAGWTALYVLRALTEESHLRRVDGDYDRYCERVRYRFIPGVI